MDRKIVIPGEIIGEGNSLPGEWTEKRGDNVVALRYGLADESNRLVKIIPLSGVYQPRMGNVIIGKVIDITFNGWLLDIGGAEDAFLHVAEVPRSGTKGGTIAVQHIGNM